MTLNSKLKTQNLKLVKGQVMLITVLVLSAITLAASAVGSVLTASALKQARAIPYSAMALYAADAGVEYELYQQKVLGAGGSSYPKPTFINGASFTSQQVSGFIRSVGKFQNIYRAFEVSL